MCIGRKYRMIEFYTPGYLQRVAVCLLGWCHKMYRVIIKLVGGVIKFIG